MTTVRIAFVITACVATAAVAAAQSGPRRTCYADPLDSLSSFCPAAARIAGHPDHHNQSRADRCGDTVKP